MRRREFITLLGSLAAAGPSMARAQAAREPQIGFLYPGVAATMSTRITALREGLRAAGYPAAFRLEVSGRASEGDPARLAALAADLVQHKVDLIVAVSPAAVQAAKTATATIPIVADDLESDPVRRGFAARVPSRRPCLRHSL